MKAPITPSSIRSDTQESLEKAKSNDRNLLRVQTGNQWLDEAKSCPIPKMLFGELWLEGELCILYADTNLGKSILAVQIGDSISKGRPVQGLLLEAAEQPVLYADFELSFKQFENRYSENYENHYRFSDKFFRAEIDPNNADPSEAGFKEFEEYLFKSLEAWILKTNARILIVDNITYLKQETEKAKHALPLMKQLKALKDKYGLSILALAHTPKRDLSKPITRNDLQGSKMLINFCDSSFSIGESSQDKSIRYIKQIKARSTEIVYDTENVITCQIVKPSNFLHFEFSRFETERDHLRMPTENEKAGLEANILSLKESEPNLSTRAIAERLGTNHMKVKRVLDKPKL